MSRNEIAAVLGKDFVKVQELAQTLKRDPENRVAYAKLSRIITGYSAPKLAALKLALAL